MNWEMFFAAIVWSMTVGSCLTGIISASGIPDNRAPKTMVVTFIGAIIVLILCIAVIAGMGWHPSS
ncbi:uncharacterized protein YacL [Paenibacillus sp. DS2015]|uniref:hypothetical protein n=1 Tax=Paenibacillus sp. DS2015 TaxID=3373917 RepID=UPI003D258735